VERNLQLFGSASGYFELGTQLRWILNNFFTFGFLFAYGLRAWLVYFDYCTGVAMLAEITHWEAYTPKVREQLEWFVLNKRYYGSPKYLAQFSSGITIILTLIIWGWIVVSEVTFYYGLVIIYSAVILILMTVTKKITVIEDLLLIRRELLLEFRIMAGFFSLLGVLIIFGSAMGWDYCKFFAIEASVFGMTAMASVSTWWMLDKSQLLALPMIMQQRLQQLGEKNDQDERLRNAPPLEAVLNDKEGLIFFMWHLIRELSFENVIFLADVMNYKNSFMQNMQVFKSIPGFSIRMQNVAKFRRESHSTFVHYAWTLSQEYVENISVSYVTAIRDESRDHIFDRIEAFELLDERQMTPEEWTNLCNVFDEAAKEVWTLLNESWLRYVTAPNFVEFKMAGDTKASDNFTSKMAEEVAQELNNNNPNTVEGAIEVVHNRTTTQQDKLNSLVVNTDTAPKEPPFQE